MGILNGLLYGRKQLSLKEPSVDASQVMRTWYLANKAVENNAQRLLEVRKVSDPKTEIDVGMDCAEKMKVLCSADESLMGLEGQKNLPPILNLYYEAEADKGCKTCWISSCIEANHSDCNVKINRWFGYRYALMAYINAVYFRGRSPTSEL